MTIIGACQTPDIRENLETSLCWIELFAQQAQDEIDLLCFPECFLQGYLTDIELAQRHAIDLKSPAFRRILTRLALLQPMLVFGLIESEQSRLFNTAVVVDRGRLLGRYRKQHLMEGERIFSTGDASPLFEIKGLTFGIMICYDSNFSECFMNMAHRGAKLALCPANNMMRRDVASRWKDQHNAIRCQHAKEAGLWLLSSDVTGEREGSISYGPTAVISPDGQVTNQVPLHEVGMVSAAI